MPLTLKTSSLSRTSLRLAEAGAKSGCQSCPLGKASLPASCPFHNVGRDPGEILVAQGEVPPAVAFVRAGSVVLSSVLPSGDETYCAVRGPGSLFGLELLGGEAAAYQAWALSPVVLCLLSAGAFRQWLGRPDSPMGAVLLLALGEAERRRRDRAALAGTALVRVARFLVERRQIEGRDAPLSVSRQVLARMLGMRPETLSRAVATLRSRGVLAQKGSLRVLDPKRLAGVAGSAG